MKTLFITLNNEQYKLHIDIDPYHADTNQFTKTAIEIDPADNRITIGQDMDDNAIPEPIWYGRIIHAVVSGQPLDAGRVETYLTEDATELLETIIRGHDIYCNGNNRVGNLSDDASDALDKIINQLAEMTAENGYWTVDEWLSQSSAVDFDIVAETTDEQLREIAAKIERDADVSLVDDVYPILEEWRDQLVDELETD